MVELEEEEGRREEEEEEEEERGRREDGAMFSICIRLESDDFGTKNIRGLRSDGEAAAAAAAAAADDDDEGVGGGEGNIGAERTRSNASTSTQSKCDSTLGAAPACGRARLALANACGAKTFRANTCSRPMKTSA